MHHILVINIGRATVQTVYCYLVSTVYLASFPGPRLFRLHEEQRRPCNRKCCRPGNEATVCPYAPDRKGSCGLYKNYTAMQAWVVTQSSSHLCCTLTCYSPLWKRLNFQNGCFCKSVSNPAGSLFWLVGGAGF